MKATHTGPLLRRRSRSLIWTGRPEGSGSPWRREGDFLLTPSGPLVNCGRRTRALAKREVDGVYRWVGRAELALDTDGVRVENTVNTYILRSCYDSGLTGWTTSIPAGASIAAEATSGAFMFADDVTTQNIVLTQAAPAAAENSVRQTFVYPTALWGDAVTISNAVAVGHLDTSGAPLSIAVQDSTGAYYNWAGAWVAPATYYDLPVRSTPTIDWIAAPFRVATLGGYVGATIRVCQKPGVAAGAVNRVYYTNVHDRPYFNSPVRNLGTLGEQRHWDKLWLPNYLGARCVPERYTLSAWVKTHWNMADVFETVVWTRTFGVCLQRSGVRFDELLFDQSAQLVKFVRRSGADFTAQKSIPAHARDQWYHLGARVTGADAELGLTAYTLSVFVDGVKGTDAVSAAMTLTDQSTLQPGAAATGSANIYPLDGTFRNLEIFTDCLTDAEIAAIYAAGPGA